MINKNLLEDCKEEKWNKEKNKYKDKEHQYKK